jgi:hypothetical protein
MSLSPRYQDVHVITYLFPQIKLAGKTASLILSEVHAHACNLSSLGLSNICAHGGYCLSVAFEGNARFFFVCESMPSKE